MKTKKVQLLEIEIGDWPGGALIGFECKFPEAPDGGIDLILPIQCATHARSWYWCPNARVVWCDGGAPDWHIHVWGEESAEARI